MRSPVRLHFFPPRPFLRRLFSRPRVDEKFATKGPGICRRPSSAVPAVTGHLLQKWRRVITRKEDAGSISLPVFSCRRLPVTSNFPKLRGPSVPGRDASRDFLPVPGPPEVVTERTDAAAFRVQQRLKFCSGNSRGFFFGGRLSFVTSNEITAI